MSHFCTTLKKWKSEIVELWVCISKERPSASRKTLPFDRLIHVQLIKYLSVRPVYGCPLVQWHGTGRVGWQGLFYPERIHCQKWHVLPRLQGFPDAEGAVGELLESRALPAMCQALIDLIERIKIIFYILHKKSWSQGDWVSQLLIDRPGLEYAAQHSFHRNTLPWGVHWAFPAAGSHCLTRSPWLW